MAVLLALSLAFRIALLPHRWVNPDEGAHLMDGKLVLDGLVPIADFDSRQVLYVYLLAGWERLVGAELIAARVLPMLLGIGVSALVFLLGRYLVGTRAALVATATYAFLPIALIWTLNVHLEVVTLVFTALGYLALARVVRTEASPRSTAVVGIIFGITFYFRESALAHVLASAVVLATLGRRAPRRLATQLLALLAGFVAVAGIAAAFFSLYLSPIDLWASSLNPLHLPLKALGLLPASAGAADIGLGRDVRQSWETTQRNLRDALFFGCFLLLAAATAFGLPVFGRRRVADNVALLILGAWLGSLGLAYGYWVWVFGFYPQYFTEFLPPLVILFGAVASSAADEWLPSGTGGPALGVFLLALAAAFVAGAHAAVPSAAYVVLAALAIGAAGVGPAGLRRWRTAAGMSAVAAAVFALAPLLPPGTRRGLWVLVLLLGVGAALAAVLPARPGARERFAFGVLLMLGGSALMAYDYSGHRIGLAYYCVWPRSVLAEVTSRIRSSTRPGDEVLSGGVIWAFEAGRHPFLDISHPLSYLDGLTVEEGRVIAQGLARHAPRVIVLDGYTERTILPDSTARERLLDDRYQGLGQVPGGRFPVSLFLLRTGASEVSPTGSLPGR